MRTPLSIALAVLVAAASTSCTTTQGTSGMDVAIAKQSADSLWTRYAFAVDQHDSVMMGGLFTEDVRLDFSDAPSVAGRAAAAAFLQGRYRDFDATGFRVRPDDFKVSETVAVQGGAFEKDGSMPGKPAQREYGRYVLVMEKGEKGEWKIARLTAIADSLRPLP